jgi:hypothetical protein
VQERMRDVTTRDVTVFCCLQCERFYRRRPELCEREGHQLVAKRKKEWRFECAGCRHRTFHDGPVCAKPCSKCGKSAWRAASIYNVGGGGTDAAPAAETLRTHGDPVQESLRTEGAHDF